MSVENQFKVTLNRHKVNMKEKGPSWTVFYDYTLKEMCCNLNKSGMVVYLYLCMQIPHYYDEKINPDNKRPRPFDFSPEAIIQFSGMSRDSVTNGWNELIKHGYIKPAGKNKFYFTDDINEERKKNLHQKIEEEQEDKILTIEEVFPDRKKQKEEPHPKYDWE